MNNNQIKNEKQLLFVNIIHSLWIIIKSLFISGLCIYFFINGANTIDKIIIFPFVICGITVLIRGLTLLIQSLNTIIAIKISYTDDFDYANKVSNINKKLEKVDDFAIKLFLFIFLVFWFGALIFYDYNAIKNWENGGFINFLFSIIFWITGFYMIKIIVNENSK